MRNNKNDTDQEVRLSICELKITRKIPQDVLLSPGAKNLLGSDQHGIENLHQQIRTSARVRKKKTFDPNIWSA